MRTCDGCGRIRDNAEFILVHVTNGMLTLCRQCLDDVNRKNPALEPLRAALRDAITSTARAGRKCVEVDAAGNTYTVDWLPEVRRWAALCGLDLEKLDPCFYVR